MLGRQLLELSEMIIRVNCVAHGIKDIPPVDFYSFDQVARHDNDRRDPREGYKFDYDQVDCPVDALHHDFEIEVFFPAEDASSLTTVSPVDL